jgi:TonB family protein
MRALAPWLAIAVLLQAMPAAAQNSESHSSFPKPAKIRLSDKAVTAEVSDCGDWLRRLDELPHNHKWAEFQQPPRAPAKGEFETTAEYESRLAAYGRQLEPTWVNVGFKVDPNALTYDADRGVMLVHYGTDKAGLDGSFSEKNAYTGVNVFGVTAEVTAMNLRSTAAKFEPSETALPRKLEFAMAPAAARDLKERGIVHVLGVLLGTEGKGGFSRATLSSPTDFSYGHNDIRIQPICVAVTVGDLQIASWRFFSMPSEAIALTSPVPKPGAIQQALADYPSRALREGLEGRVGFLLTVNEYGRVSECEVTSSSGHAVLDQAACQNLRRYARFEPATRYGEPVAGQFESSLVYSVSQ